MTGDPFDFDGFERPCSMARQVTVVVGSLASAVAAVGLVTLYAYRKFLGRTP